MLESRQTIQKILIICLGFVLFSQVSSATDYYVASYGNDSSNGLTVNTPKVTFSFFAGTNFLQPGDIVYLIDGTWSNQHMIIKSTGNATHPIRITKYNGTPILDGTDRLGTGIIVGQDGGDNFVYPYVNIDNITITRYADGFFSREGMFINLSDMHIYNISTTAVNFLDGHDLNLKDSIIHDTGWNSIQVKSNYYNCYNVIIQNNTVYSNPGVSGGSGHNLIDLYEHFESSNLYRVHNITVEKNRLYDSTNDGIYLHTYNDGTTLPNQSINNTYIYNNTINGTYNGITFDHARNSIISGNIVYDMNAGSGMGYWTGYDYFDNNTLINNTFYGTGLRGFGGIGDTSSSYINLSENNISQYREYTGIANIQNPKLFGYAIINDASTGTVILNYTQGYVFTENGANSVSYLSNGSQYTTVSTGETVTVIKYDIAALPSSGNLTITSPSQTGDSRQITSTVGGGTIIFEGLMENASANYDLWIAGVKEQTVVSGANKVVTFAAETLSGTSIIVINYSTSSGEALSYIPPSPTTLAETNSSSGFWINYTWSAGSGNVTNSYNVSWNNGVDWVNGSTNAFQNFTSLSPHQWVNVSVYAFNSSGNGTLNQTPISMNTQVPNNAPTISFISPTMANGSTNTTGSITVNTTHSDADSDNTTALLNWNNSLVGWWRMNEASGGTLVQDFSGYGNNGTWSGNTTSNVTSGQFGNALSFDGVNDYVNAGNDNSISNLSENFSVLVWFKLYSLPEAGQYPHIVSQRDLSSSNWNIIVHSDFNGNLSFSVPYSTTAANGRIITPILNTWYHLSVVIQTKVIYMYINGVEQSYVSRTTGVGTRTLNSSIPIGIGNRIGGGRDVNGSIDEVRIYNRALSANEISASYNASLYRLNATFSGLADGEYNYTAYVQDVNGSVTATEKRFVTIDTLPDIPPAPINLTNTTGSFWVNHTWEAGSGNVTDSFNVSHNGTWINGSSVTFLNTSLEPLGWSNITIWAWNNSVTGTLSLTSISDNSQAPDVPMSIQFIDPTPANNSIIVANYLHTNFSIYGTNQLSEFILNRNNINYTIFNSTNILLMDLNNNDNIGEIGTTIIDNSLNNNNGSWIGNTSPNWSNSGTLSFDGINDYINIPNSNSLNITNAISIEILVQVNGSSSSNAVGLVGKQLGNSVVPYMLSYNPTYKIIQFSDYNGTANDFSVDTGTIENGTWYHVVATFDNSLESNNVKIYTNGILAGQETFTGELPLNAQPVYIGSYNAYLNGSVNYLKIFNRSLSTTEITDLYYSNFYKINATNYIFSLNKTYLNGNYSIYGYVSNNLLNNSITETRNYVIENTINCDATITKNDITRTISISGDNKWADFECIKSVINDSSIITQNGTNEYITYYNITVSGMLTTFYSDLDYSPTILKLNGTTNLNFEYSIVPIYLKNLSVLSWNNNTKTHMPIGTAGNVFGSSVFNMNIDNSSFSYLGDLDSSLWYRKQGVVFNGINTKVIITNSTFESNDASGLLLLTTGSQTSVQTSSFKNNTYHGIYFYEQNDINIQSNYFYNNGWRSIWLNYYSNNNLINNNTFDTNAIGIEVASSHNNTVSNNTVINSTLWTDGYEVGIWDFNGINNSYISNNISDTGSICVLLLNSTDTNISNNYCNMMNINSKYSDTLSSDSNEPETGIFIGEIFKGWDSTATELESDKYAQLSEKRSKNITILNNTFGSNVQVILLSEGTVNLTHDIFDYWLLNYSLPYMTDPTSLYISNNYNTLTSITELTERDDDYKPRLISNNLQKKWGFGTAPGGYNVYFNYSIIDNTFILYPKGFTRYWNGTVKERISEIPYDFYLYSPAFSPFSLKSSTIFANGTTYIQLYNDTLEPNGYHTMNITATPDTDYVIVNVTSINNSYLSLIANATNVVNVTFTAWGYTPGQQYHVKKNGISHQIVTANATGYITFINSVWSEYTFTMEEYIISDYTRADYSWWD